jgi:leucyl/phenylalanyl-tRNA--protein transferase
VEVWDGERLVGGLYGVDAGGLFTGESMFHHEPNASKLALLHLIDHLAARGATWIDIQQLTPHFEVLGARLISRDEFLQRLKRERERGRRLF